MTYIKSFFYFFICLLFVHCASTPENNERPLPKSRSSFYNSNQQQTTYNDIDVDALLHELGLNQPVELIGFEEKTFNACSVDANRSNKPYCQRLYLGRVNFQVLCRDSTGTVEKVKLTPLHSQNLRWKSSGKKGFTQTNSEGFGQLSFVSRYSSRRKRLYLYLGSKVALKSFKDQWKLILPKSWCSSH